MNQFRKVGLILVAILLIQSCGVKFWYNRLDWLVPWYLDDYIELSDIQEEQLELLINQKLIWHRSSQLPQYVLWIESLQSDIKSADIEQHYDTHQVKLRSFYEELLGEFAPDLAKAAAQLSDEQRKQLIENLEKEDKEWAEELKELTAEESLERRTENIKDSVSDWVGRLSDYQIGLINQWASEQQSTSVLRMAYRAKWREAFNNLLVLPTDDEASFNKKTEELTSLFLQSSRYQSSELKELFEINRALSRYYLIKLHASLSEQQKKRLINKLNDYKEDFESLIDE